MEKLRSHNALKKLVKNNPEWKRNKGDFIGYLLYSLFMMVLIGYLLFFSPWKEIVFNETEIALYVGGNLLSILIKTLYIITALLAIFLLIRFVFDLLEIWEGRKFSKKDIKVEKVYYDEDEGLTPIKTNPAVTSIEKLEEITNQQDFYEDSGVYVFCNHIPVIGCSEEGNFLKIYSITEHTRKEIILWYKKENRLKRLELERIKQFFSEGNFIYGVVCKKKRKKQGSSFEEKEYYELKDYGKPIERDS